MTDPTRIDLGDEVPLGTARERLREAAEDGAICPCCQQHVKVYKRKLNSGIAYALILLYKAGAVEHYVHKPTVLKGKGSSARDESIARYWGLMVEETERREDGGRSGYWKLTALGREFVCGRSRVRSHARIYDGKCLGLTGDVVSIEDCLGSKFDYRELMNA